MTEKQREIWADLVWFFIIVAFAAGIRAWYLWTCIDQAAVSQPLLLAQDPSPRVDSTQVLRLTNPDYPTELDNLLFHLRQNGRSFASRAPLSTQDEHTAHVAPGYPWLVFLLSQFVEDNSVLTALRWLQCALGAITAGLIFLFARQVFQHYPLAVVAGVLCAVHPFWIVNTAQAADGVLTCFLFASALLLGVYCAQTGAAIPSLPFGLCLAALALVRAPLLPFAFAALVWFLLRCRDLPRGWLCGLLAVLGFINGIPPWTVRNYQTFGDIVPIVNSAYVHLWLGNNPHVQWGTGSNVADSESKSKEEQLRRTLQPERLAQLLVTHNQRVRYRLLAEDYVKYTMDHPVATVRNRIWALLHFYFGGNWFEATSISEPSSDSFPTNTWFVNHFQLMVQCVLLGMLVLAFIGWRWSYSRHSMSGLATLSVLLVPLPYILSHAELFWGPRLPLDGVLLCYVAFAILCLLPGFRNELLNDADADKRRGSLA